MWNANQCCNTWLIKKGIPKNCNPGRWSSPRLSSSWLLQGGTELILRLMCHKRRRGESRRQLDQLSSGNTRGRKRRLNTVLSHHWFLLLQVWWDMSAKSSIRLAEKISKKKNERYEDIVRFLRVKFSYLALRATLLCLRRSRSTFKATELDGDFGLALNELSM